MTRCKQIKGKKVAAYKVAAGAFDLLNQCPDLFYGLLRKNENNMSAEAMSDMVAMHDLLQKIVWQVYKTSIKPANAEIEASSKRNAIGGKVLKVDEETIGKDGFNEALKRHADERHRNGKHAATGWKGGIPKHLGLSAWKYVEPRLPEWGYDEKDVIELLKEKDRENESR